MEALLKTYFCRKVLRHTSLFQADNLYICLNTCLEGIFNYFLANCCEVNGWHWLFYMLSLSLCCTYPKGLFCHVSFSRCTLCSPIPLPLCSWFLCVVLLLWATPLWFFNQILILWSLAQPLSGKGENSVVLSCKKTQLQKLHSFKLGQLQRKGFPSKSF